MLQTFHLAPLNKFRFPSSGIVQNFFWLALAKIQDYFKHLQKSRSVDESCSTKILRIFKHQEKEKMPSKYTNDFFETTENKSDLVNAEIFWNICLQ